MYLHAIAKLRIISQSHLCDYTRPSLLALPLDLSLLSSSITRSIANAAQKLARFEEIHQCTAAKTQDD